MADDSQPQGNARRFPGLRLGERSGLAGRFFALRAADVQLYRVCDDLSGALIFPMVIFGPWAFGTTQPWSIGTMNVAGCALGALLLFKLFVRQVKGFRPQRWEYFSTRSGWQSRRRHPFVQLLTRTLAGLTLALLVYCLISALNAAATYNPDTRLFAYHHHLKWLPHSMDSHRTWAAFWMYLGLAGSFWGIRDWLLGMTLREERAIRASAEGARPSAVLPERLRRLLWVLCLNGVLLGVECIVQRASGTNKLLFFEPTHTNREAVDQLGPYAYRSNAAQYFNLLWPLCLGFWWTLHRTGGLRHKAHHVLLFCAAIMAACPLLSASRGGALVAAGILIMAVIFLTATNLFLRAWRLPDRKARRGMATLLGVFFVLAVSLGWYFGWAALKPRMEQIGEGFKYREAMYAAAEPMAADYPVFGTGPGTFGTVFQLYRISNATYWPEQLHNDWLETRITFGWCGLVMALAALACVGLRWFAPGGLRTGRRFMILAWLGLAGCLVHARFDFPFQIHSIVFLFLLICAVLFSTGRRAHGSHR